MKLSFWCRMRAGIFLLLLAIQAQALPDDFEQRLAACASCHGEYGHGDPASPSVPRLAQKPAGYLYKQLISFKMGNSQSPEMEYIVSHLSPEYLHKIAQYYASQRVPYHPQTLPATTPKQLARGEELVKKGDDSRGIPACQACHGEALTGVTPMIPGIVNQPFDYLATQLKLWRTNARSTKSTHCMWVVANRLRPSDVHAVAAWLASQPLPENTAPITEAQLPTPLPGWCTLEQEGAQP